MARSLGARARLALGFETAYGTPPVSGFIRMPFAPGLTVAAEQQLLDSELLGYGRDPLAPVKDAITADGDVVVPIDAEALGPVAQGRVRGANDDHRHRALRRTNSSLAPTTCPAWRSRRACPRCRTFAMYSGCRLDRLQLVRCSAAGLSAPRPPASMAQGEDKRRHQHRPGR